MSRSQDLSLANVVGTTLTDKHSQDVLKKFEWAIKQVTSEHSANNETALTQDELVQLIKTWEPQRDIICLYVRWARQLRRNFNLDSIATLLCLSRQCGYTPVDFLRNVKTLSVHKNQKSTYGVSFHFDIPNRKDVHRERLNKEFLGLSVTLSLLEEQVTESPSILGKTGMRQSLPRKAYPMDIPIAGDKMSRHASVVTHPNVEFHTQSSLLNRIWISINHRWLALFLTEHLFREVKSPCWSYQDALVYSFQMTAPCGPGRYEFLSPLVGYCLRFRTPESIECKRSRLKEIWNDPSSFLSYGNTCLAQFSADAQARIIIACFEDLRSEILSTSNKISYNRDCSLNRRWTILRAYILHFWLDSTANSSIKTTVTNAAPPTTRKKKRKADNLYNTDILAHDSSLLTTLPPSQAARKFPSLPRKQSRGDIPSIISSRRKSIATATSKVGNLKDTPVTAPIYTTPVGKSMPIKDTIWTNLRLITSEEQFQFVQSYLLIHRLDGVDVLSELSPLEVYSADRLHDLMHCRLSGKSPFFPTKKIRPVVLHVRPEADSFIDSYAKSFHVARENSEYFDEHLHHLPSMTQIQSLCKAIVCHGNTDSKRATGQYRVNIGNGGQNWVNGAPCALHGLQFQKDIEKDRRLNLSEVLQSIGQITEFTWRVTCALQNDAADHPIAPDALRKQLYASHLNEYLNMDNDVGFEDLVLVVSSLHPAVHDVSEHKDAMNDTLAGYTRTAAFNMVMIDDSSDTPTILLLQVICNFRKVIGQYVIPFHRYLSPVAKHARLYLDKWHRSIQSVYAGKAEKVPTAYDRSTFFLDDTLEYTTVTISEEGKHRQTISAEYILTEVNISRTLSLSMFIDPLVNLQRFLKFDQTIELAFACSFLSNPFWFNWTMSTLIQRLDDPNNPYQLGVHPFYDWSRNTIETFGTWQGGPYNRWSPCGGNKETVLETFGAQPNATKEERDRGERKLSHVISILWDHVEWINSLAGKGNNPVVEMPLTAMKERSQHTISEISKIASCQFSHFRLGILTTILSGCGLLKQGKHLRHLMYPVKGSASSKHLCCPVGDFMSPERARALGDNKPYESISNDGNGSVGEDHHDLFMQYLSAELGFKVYVRDEMWILPNNVDHPTWIESILQLFLFPSW